MNTSVLPTSSSPTTEIPSPNSQYPNSVKAIIFCVDDDEKNLMYLRFALESALSVFECETYWIKWFVCTNKLEWVKNKLYDFSKWVEFIDVIKTAQQFVEDSVSGLEFAGKPASPMQSFRLFLHLVPELSAYSKIVYCDTDVEFINKNFLSIFDIPAANDYDVLGVIDGRTDDLTYRLHLCKDLMEYPAYKDAPQTAKERLWNQIYINSGVMMMNLDRIRQHQYTPKWISDTIRNNGFTFVDQDFINLFYDVGIIGCEYNSYSVNSMGSVQPYLRHYAGTNKPNQWYYPPTGQYKPPRDAIDIMYVCGDNNDDTALKYSLRSICLNGGYVGRIIIVSPRTRPWLSDNVIQLVVDDTDDPLLGRKHCNIVNAVFSAVSRLNMHGEFLVSSDDHIYLQYTDFTRQPFFYSQSTIPTAIPKGCENDGSENWRQSCIDTGKLLKLYDLPTIFFQRHSNAHWNADLMRDYEHIFHFANALPYGVEPHVLMQNIYLKEQPDIPLQYAEDNKINTIADIPPNIDCISFGRNDFNQPDIKAFLENRFNQKCRLEK